MNNMQTIWDPLRKKNVALTPEEKEEASQVDEEKTAE